MAKAISEMTVKELVDEIRAYDPDFKDSGWKKVGLIEKLEGLRANGAPTPATTDDNKGKDDDLAEKCLIKDFGREQSSALCSKCEKQQAEVFKACADAIAAAKATSGTKKGGGAGGKRPPKAKTFEDLENFYVNGDVDLSTITHKVDRMLFQGVAPSEIVDAVCEIRKYSSDEKIRHRTDFSSTSTARAHIKFREKQGWKFEEDSEGRFMAVDFEPKNGAISKIEGHVGTDDAFVPVQRKIKEAKAEDKKDTKAA